MTNEQTSSTQNTPSGRQNAPPQWMFKVVNPILKALLRSPLHGLFSKYLLLISITGRKTGNKYTFPVGYQEEGNQLTIFTFHDWHKNLGDGAPVTVYLRGKKRSGMARPTQDPEAIKRFVEGFHAQRGTERAKQMGVTIDNKDIVVIHITLNAE